MQSNTSAAQLHKARENAATALNPGSDKGKVQATDKKKNNGKREREERPGVIQSHQCCHSQVREPEL